MSTAVALTDEWEWTPQREECLELFLSGKPKIKIAKDLGVHRNTINNWTAHPTFLATVRERLAEHRDGTQLKRTREIGALADVAAKQAFTAAKLLDQNPNDPGARRTFREFSDEYRQNLREEREVLGTNVKRVETRLIGDMEHTHHAGQSFKATLLDRVKKQVIDTEAIEKAPNAMEAVQQITRKLLVADPSVLNALHEQDKAAEAQAMAEAKKR